MIQFDEERQNMRVDELRHREAEELAKTLSYQYQIPYIDLSLVSINTDALRTIAEPLARETHVAAFQIVGKKLYVVTASPSTDAVKKVLADLTSEGYEITLYLGSHASLERAWERYKEVSKSLVTKAGQIEVAEEQVSFFLSQAKGIGDIKQLIEKAAQERSSTSAVLEIMVAGALALKASDIHIEPEETATRLRFRLDGVLAEITSFPTEYYRPILSRIKLVSALKLNIKAARQDGRFTIHVGELEIEIRTSIIPGAYGESIVLRILDPRSIEVPLEALGMEPRLLEVVLEEVAKPNGLLLTTGPTGSGKTTTLYALLKRLNEPGVKIITIEDPIEYHIQGITQTQTDSKRNYTFAEGLKSALRQDPDIIMVGEIRDDETAATAIDSALTGHLVFSTLHTNNAAGAIPRLIDLHVNPKVIGPALTLALAQRLLRKLCTECKKAASPDERETVIIERIRKGISDRGLTPPPLGQVYKPVGCDKCHEGYKGRIGIFEGIKMDETVERTTISGNPGEREIFAAAKPQKLLTMSEDGIGKVLSGTTSLEELERVVDLS